MIPCTVFTDINIYNFNCNMISKSRLSKFSYTLRSHRIEHASIDRRKADKIALESTKTMHAPRCQAYCHIKKYQLDSPCQHMPHQLPNTNGEV